MFAIIKKLCIGIVLVAVVVLLTIIGFVQYWASTEQGKLPPKTAVILHAINHNLVTLDMSPPRILANKGSSMLDKFDQQIPVSDGTTIPVRIHRPSGEGPYPMILYYHGGAFLEGYGSIDTHENVTRSLAVQTQSVVISVGYRVAPSYTFPTAIEDSYEALLWAVEKAEELNGDPNRIAVAGDSAGGNIATVVAAMSRDRQGPELKAQVLLYPVTTFQEVSLPSREFYDSGYFLLSRQVMYLAREKYTPQEVMWFSPYTSPLHAEDLSGLPPALIITAEFDPLRDEGEAYAERLSEFGVTVEAMRYRGVMHGFISFYEVMYRGKHGLNETSSFLRRAFYDKLEAKPYQLQVIDPPLGMAKVRDQLEAYAFAAYLLGKKVSSILHR
ncbi:acetyl esterase [Caldalkalibacillus uzonensis]|uniref:Acetyl esterase n=1 Tax=Caldalkalibacillus uzonensis TaxID=353224 RepID=A0ABU0CM05_9BACI|nr:alpha/beta hydrolase [Caldalkalibacillus uzonensis]MDQ0337447.1 acetyl esterase [Caldalkalibacillus uzonensis]